jgi:RNA polymerase sigma-70 factor (ECF subfamily)
LIERSWDEPDTFAQLYDRHAAAIFRFAARRLGDQVAEDVVAETFLAAFRRRHRYDLTRADARPWLYGIAVNVIGKHRRSEVRMLRAFARTGTDPVADGDLDQIDDRLCAAGVGRELAAALAGLTGADRDVLLLIAWAELSYEEAAAALEIPIGTVRSRLSRARREVRAALGGRHPTSLERGAVT